MSHIDNAPGREIRVGILGAAKIAPSAIIAPARKRSDVCVRYVAARDPARAARFAHEHGLVSLPSYHELVQREDIDLVYVALPPAAHAHWSMRALAAGKAVLCEKPFALNAREASEMVAAARAARRPLMEAFHYVHHEAMRKAADIVDSGALGTLTDARAEFCARIAQSPEELRWSAAQGGGAIMDLGCYPLHALRTLLRAEPDVRSAAATFALEVDAETSAVLQFPGGILARIDCSMISPEVRWSLQITGRRGALTLSNYVVPQLGCVLSTRVGEDSRETVIGGPTTYEAQLGHVVNVMKLGHEPRTGGADAIANMTVIDSIREHARRPRCAAPALL